MTMRICLCGVLAGRVHRADCPYPEYRSDDVNVDRWAALKEGTMLSLEHLTKSAGFTVDASVKRAAEDGHVRILSRWTKDRAGAFDPSIHVVVLGRSDEDDDVQAVRCFIGPAGYARALAEMMKEVIPNR